MIFANLGVDTSSGGDGNDVLWAMARGDVAPGPGVDQVGDTLDGGNGNDLFRTRDGEVDRITCGAGDDRALLDNVDVITDATARTRTAPARPSSARRPAAPAARAGGRPGGSQGGEGHGLTTSARKIRDHPGRLARDPAGRPGGRRASGRLSIPFGAAPAAGRDARRTGLTLYFKYLLRLCSFA